MSTQKRSRRGTGRIYKRGKKGTWWYRPPGSDKGERLIDESGRPITDKRVAERMRQEKSAKHNAMCDVDYHTYELHKANGSLEKLRKNQNRIPVDDIFDHFKESPRRNPSMALITLDQYRGQLRMFLEFLPASVLWMDEVTEEHAIKYAQNLKSSKRKAQTGDKHITALQKVWRCLRPKSHNPWQGLKIQKPKEELPYRCYEIEEIRSIYRALKADGYIEGELAIAFMCGYCFGWDMVDCAFIELSDIDLSNGLISRKRKKTLNRKKGKDRPMEGWMSNQLIPLIEAQMQNKKGKDRLFPHLYAAYISEKSNISKIFSRKVYPQVQLVDVEGTQYGWKSLRHCFQTRLDKATIDPRIIAICLGHKVHDGEADSYCDMDTRHARWDITATHEEL